MKGTRWVLRREGGSNSSDLSDNSKFKDNGEAIHSVFTKNILANNTYNNDTLNLNDTNYVSTVNGNGIRFNFTNNTINITNIPARFDLREWGWVTPVKNQGDMGACWSFGSLGAIESALLKSAGITSDFSENNLQHAMLKYQLSLLKIQGLEQIIFQKFWVN